MEPISIMSLFCMIVVVVVSMLSNVESFTVWIPTRQQYGRGNTIVASTVFMSETAEEASTATVPTTTTATATTTTDTPVTTTESSTSNALEMTPEEAASAKRKVQRERYTLFVGNLPFDITEEQIKELFVTYGKVDLINIPRDKITQKPRGFAFVDMSSEEELQAAVAGADGTTIDDRTVRVMKSINKGDAAATKAGTKSDRPPRKGGDGPATSPAGTKKIYVGNIPFTATKEELSELYSEYGEVIEVYIPPNTENGLGRGFAFVTMKEDDVVKAIEATNRMEYQGRKLVVNEPLPPGKKAPPRVSKKDTEVKLYVGNLSFYTVVQTLYDIFGEFGEVLDCYLPEDPNTGASRGFGFVTMKPDAAARAIQEIDGCEVDGRVIKVNEAQPKGAVVKDRDPDSSTSAASEMDEEETSSWNQMDDQ